MFENQILYGTSLLCFILILFSAKFGKQFAFINSGIFFLYSVILYYNFLYKGDGRSSFLW